MSDETGEYLQEKINHVEKHFGILPEVSEFYFHKQKSTSGAGTKLAADLTAYAAGEPDEMKEYILALGESIKTMEYNRSRALLSAQEFFIDGLRKYQETIRVTKEALTIRESAMQKLIAKQKQIKKLSSARNAAKLSQVSLELAGSVAEVERLNSQLSEQAKEFEKSRVQMFQKLLHEYAHSQLFYHARGVETMSALASKIKELDPEDAVEDMKEVLKGIGSMLNDEV